MARQGSGTLWLDPLRRIQRSEGPDYGNFINFLEPIYAYDSLFDYIKGNEDLARSVGRFVPWVKTSEDVRTLLDVYLLQTMTKRVLRYQYFGTAINRPELRNWRPRWGIRR